MLDEAGNLFRCKIYPGARSFRLKESCSARIRFRYYKTGEEKWSIVDATPVFDADGNVIQAVNIFRNITDLIANEQAQKVLAEAGKLFAESLSYEETMTSLANLVVQHIADWCTVHLVTEENTRYSRSRLRIKIRGRCRWRSISGKRYPPNWDLDTGLPRVLRTGEAEFYPEITEEMLVAGAQDAEHLAIIPRAELSRCNGRPTQCAQPHAWGDYPGLV